MGAPTYPTPLCCHVYEVRGQWCMRRKKQQTPLNLRLSLQVTVTITQAEGNLVRSEPSRSADGAAVVLVECDPPMSSLPTLAPGEALECIVRYLIDREDVNRGEVSACIRR